MMATAKRSYRPSTENRAESVERLWTELREALPHAEQLLQSQAALNERDFRARDIRSIGAACWQRANHVMKFALVALHAGQSERSELLREAVSLMYWGAEILQYQRRVEPTSDEFEDTFFLERIWLHGLAAGGGAGHIANWTATYLSRVFAATGGTGGILELRHDPAFRVFIGEVMRANVEGHWPKDIDRTTTRTFGDLLIHAGDRAAFRKALIPFGDYRVAQAFGYDGIEATKRRPESRTGSVLDAGGWIKVFPVELFSLKYVYENATGGALSLNGDHPLLETPAMELPALLPLYEDDFIRRAVALAREVLGNAWRPVIS
jgi:hypothetical protein